MFLACQLVVFLSFRPLIASQRSAILSRYPACDYVVVFSINVVDFSKVSPFYIWERFFKHSNNPLFRVIDGYHIQNDHDIGDNLISFQGTTGPFQ